jgi:long-chain fatty acid transport protein
VSLARGALLTCALLVTSTLHATAAEVFELGPRGRALAGGGLSRYQGYESAFANPAALSLAERPELTLGYSANRFALEALRAGTRVAVPAQGSGDVLFGFVLPLRIAEQRWVLGFASQSPSDFIARAQLPLADVPQFPLLVPQSQALDFDLALGVSVWPGLRLGAGLRALAALSGSVEISASSAGTTAHARDTLEPRFAPVLGALFEPSEHDAVALAFHGPLRADFAIELSGADIGATKLPPLHISGVAAYDPLELALEYRRQLGALTLLGGLAYRRWSRFPDLLAATVTCPAARPNCMALPAEHAHFHDTLEPHLGVEYLLALRPSARARLSAGYAYRPTPIPEQSGASNWLDANRHVLGLGYGVELGDSLLPLDLELGCELNELAARTHVKRGVAADNPGYPALTSRGHAESCAFTVGARLQ